jgi:diguanylate cyclase (GGDEF)-like protein/PAS domain S-box-containing protein
MEKEDEVSYSRFPLRFYALVLVLTSVVLSVLGWNSYRSFHIHQNEQERTFRLNALQYSILYLDEVLTMSARMAAATGDSQWEGRYRIYEPKYKEFIGQIKEIGPYGRETSGEWGRREKLGQIENLIFALVRQNRKDEALAIIFRGEYEEQKQIYNKGFQVYSGTPGVLLAQNLKERIIYLDEVLTMSARMAAATGDLRWEQRYRSFEPQLETAIEQAMEFAPFGKEAAAQTEAANIKLIEMENHAFSFVRQGRLKEASQILFSDEYENQKYVYAEGMELFSQLLKQNAEATLAWERKKLIFSVAIIIAILLFLLIAWLAVLQTLRKWQKALLQVNQNLNLQTHELERTNIDLTHEIFERKRIEEALRLSEARFSGILDIAHEAIISIDEGHRILLFNKGAEQIFGYSQQEVLGGPMDILLPERFRAKHWEHVLSFVQSDVVSRRVGGRREILGKRKNGEEFFGEASISKLELGLEKIFTVVLRDITERRRTEEELRSSEERFRQFAENVKEVFWMGDVKKNQMIYISPAYEEIWGKSREILYQSLDTWLDDIHPEEKNRHSSAGSPEQGDSQEEYQIVRPDGSRRWIRDRAFPVRDQSGEIYRLAGIAEDITERKCAEQSLQKREKQQKVLSEIGALCLSTGHLTEAMEKAVKMVAEILDVEMCKILLLNEKEDCLLLAAGIGWQEGLVGKAMIPNHHGFQDGYTLMVNGPVMVENLLTETRFKGPPLLYDHQVMSGFSVPMVSQGRAIGVMGAHSKRPQKLPQDDLEFLQSVASLIAVAISRKRAEEALAEQAIRDPLTGLYNRRYFNFKMVEEIKRASRCKQTLAVLLCDLDRFKEVNDSRGHDAGDEVIKAVAKSIQDSTRGIDLVFRWGGDEIVVVLSDPTREGILTASERIRKGVHKINAQFRSDLDMSIGVSLYPEHGKGPDDLIRLADWALYLSKKGGDKIHIGEEEYHLDEHSVKVVFQPLVDLHSRKVLGYEALSRDPQGKLSILELFKRYQAIGQLYELKSLCFHLQLKKAQEAGLKRVFINVDFQLLNQIEIVPKPIEMDVILEISEVEALYDIENHLKMVKKWREKGFQFAIDDFGAGFISLPFIAQVIPDYIKLDRSTMLQAVSSQDFRNFSQDLVRALRNFSKEGIIAEGIETEKELKVVKAIGVNIGQGYLFGKPKELKS